MTTIVYIGLGSNLDGPEQQIQRACRALAVLPQSRLISVSSLYRSQPLLLEGLAPGQADYINAVAALETGLQALALLDSLQMIERLQGRVHGGPRWGPRTLDLDILLYGEETLNEERLCVPHPGLAVREFVLYPLYQIAPQLTLPGGQQLKHIVAKCPLRGLQRLQVESLETQ